MCLGNINLLLGCFSKPLALDHTFRRHNFNAIREITGGQVEGGGPRKGAWLACNGGRLVLRWSVARPAMGGWLLQRCTATHQGW